MIKVIFDNVDVEDEFKDLFPNVELSMGVGSDHAAYLADLFHRFMLVLGYSPNTVDEYIPAIDDIRTHIDDRFNAVISALEEQKTNPSNDSFLDFLRSQATYEDKNES